MSRSFFKPSETAFGVQATAHLTPVIQKGAYYEILDNDIETFTATGGTVDTIDRQYRCQTGTNSGGYGVIRSKKPAVYRPGQGMRARFTAQFTTGVANSLQFAGLFSLTDTCAVGYDGTSFSLIHDYNGLGEIQTLQVTTPAAGAEIVTVTLDSTTTTGISVTNSSAAQNAREIADALNADSNQTANWRISQNGDKIIVTAKETVDKTGTFTYTSTGALVIGFTETQQGAAKTENRVAQTSWNGTDITSWHDPTKLNVYQISFGYLGAAGICLEVFDPALAKFVEVHRLEWANANTVPQFGNPTLKVGYVAASLGSTTNLTVKGASMAIFLEGDEIPPEATKAQFISKASVGTTLTNLITLKCRLTFGSHNNLGKFTPESVSVDNDHNKGVLVEVLENADLAGFPNYVYHDENDSIVEYDTTGTTVTNGSLIDAFTVAAASSETIDLSKNLELLTPEDTVTVAVKTLSGTATNTTVVVKWREIK